MKKELKRCLYSASLAVLFVGCESQPQLAELVGEMVVLTHFEPEVDYSNYGTFSITMDTIGLVSNVSTQTALIGEFPRLVTSAILKNLTDTNHQRVDYDQDPDLGVNIYVINDLSIFQSVVYPNYYGYGGGYGGYGYGYGGYGGYGYVATQTFNTAILVIELADLTTGSQNPDIIWIANIGDLINSFDTNGRTRDAINQAFIQSEYLNR